MKTRPLLLLLLACVSLPASAADFGYQLTGVIDQIMNLPSSPGYPGPLLQVGDAVTATWFWDCSETDLNADPTKGKYHLKGGGFQAGSYNLSFLPSSSVVNVEPGNRVESFGEYTDSSDPSGYYFGTINGILLDDGWSMTTLTEALPCAPFFDPAAAPAGAGFQPVILASMAGNGSTWGQQYVLAHNATLTWLYPPAAAIAGPASFFENQTVTFSGSGGVSYQWTLGTPDPDVLLTNATSPLAQVRVVNISGGATKSFQLGLTVTDTDGLQGTTWVTLYATGRITRDPGLQLLSVMRILEDRCGLQDEPGPISEAELIIIHQKCLGAVSQLQEVVKRLSKKDGCTKDFGCENLLTSVELELFGKYPDLAAEVTDTLDLMLSAP